jgi:NAD-dependent deacetylase
VEDPVLAVRQAAFHDEATYEAKRLPGCGACHARGDFALLRPHIVWFGEHLDPSALPTVEAFVERAQRHRFVFLAVGTSGLVFPAAQLVDQARARGAETWLVNLRSAANDGAFEHVVLGPSGTLLPHLLHD